MTKITLCLAASHDRSETLVNHLDFFPKKGKLPLVENFNVIIVYKIAKSKHVQIFIKIGRVY